MIKPLLITSLCAFLAAVGFFSLAAASAVAHGDSTFWQNLEHWDSNSAGPGLRGGGPQTVRTLTWPGGDTLEVAIGADVIYTQGPVASVTVTGPKTTVDHMVFRNGRLMLDTPIRDTGDVNVVMTAPGVKKFVLAGSQNLTIAGYRQDSLDATLAGSGDLNISGAADRLKINIAGSGDVDAAALTVKDASVNIAGSGDATIAPTASVDVNIAGSGDVELTTHPANVKSSVFGSGSVILR